MKRFIGLRNIVTSKERWSYLLLYEIDSHDDYEILRLLSQLSHMETSYIVYKTKNGCHAVGLTPLNSQTWGLWFDRLQRMIPEYFSGQTLRISLKEGEKQELIHHCIRYPFVSKLFEMFAKRFPDMIETYSSGCNARLNEIHRYTCVFEKYWTSKI